MRNTILLLSATLMIFVFNLGGPRLWDRDEPRNAGCAAEMLQRGDWVTPIFNDELRTHKPVLLYWFMMASYSLFGINEFAARLPSAMFGIGTVLLVFSMGRRMFSESVGLWSGLILSSALMFGVASRAATPDAVLIFFTTLATAIFVWNTFPISTGQNQEHEFPVTWWGAAAMFGAMGLAMLAKGPIGLVLPTAVLGMYLLIRWLPEPQDSTSRMVRLLRPFAPLHFLRTCWRMRPVTALAVSVAIAAPWYIWVGLRTNGDWLQGFFLEHNVGRAMNSMEGHGGSIFYYPVAMLAGFFPWSVFLVPVILMLVRQFRANDPWNRGATLAACWVCVYLGLFSIASTKLPSYITPCYPGAALLCGCFVDRWIRGDRAVSIGWTYVALSVLALVGVIGLVGVPIAASFFLPGAAIIGAVGLVPLLVSVLAIRHQHLGKTRLAARWFAGGAVTLTSIAFGLISVEVDSHRQHHKLLDVISQRSAAPNVGSYACLEPSWVFYLQRPVFELSGRDNSQWTRAQNWDPKPRPGLQEFLARGPGHFVITTGSARDGLTDLPIGVVELAETPYFLKKDRLVLLGWVDEQAYVAAAVSRRLGSAASRRVESLK